MLRRGCALPLRREKLFWFWGPGKSDSFPGPLFCGKIVTRNRRPPSSSIKTQNSQARRLGCSENDSLNITSAGGKSKVDYFSSMVEWSMTQSAALRMPSLRRRAAMSVPALIYSTVFLVFSARSASCLSISSSVGTRFSCCAICSSAMRARVFFSAPSCILAVNASRVWWIWLR